MCANIMRTLQNIEALSREKSMKILFIISAYMESLLEKTKRIQKNYSQEK